VPIIFHPGVFSGWAMPSSDLPLGGAKGIRSVLCRLAGPEFHGRRFYLEGRVPRHTLRADIDYGFYEARTTGFRQYRRQGLIYGSEAPSTRSAREGPSMPRSGRCGQPVNRDSGRPDSARPRGGPPRLRWPATMQATGAAHSCAC